jgi:hypothetical protein
MRLAAICIGLIFLSLSASASERIYSCSNKPDIDCLRMVWGGGIYSDGVRIFAKSPVWLDVNVFSGEDIYSVRVPGRIGKFSFSALDDGVLIHPDKLPIILVTGLESIPIFEAIPFIDGDFSVLGKDIVYLEGGDSIYLFSYKYKESRELLPSGLGDGQVSDIFCSAERCHMLKGASIYSSENLKDWTRVINVSEGFEKSQLRRHLYGGDHFVRYLWGEKEASVYDGSTWNKLAFDFHIVDAIWNGSSFVFLGHSGKMAIVENGAILRAYSVDSGGKMKAASGMHYDGTSYFIIGVSDEHTPGPGGPEMFRPYFVLKSDDGEKWQDISDDLNDRLIGAIKGGSLIRVHCRKDAGCQTTRREKANSIR